MFDALFVGGVRRTIRNVEKVIVNEKKMTKDIFVDDATVNI